MSDGDSGFRITGVVQGVGFRWWVKRTGEQLGLRGAVRNVDDGSVEVNVAGAPAAIAVLEARLHEGPPGARVDTVRRSPSALPIPGRGFVIEG